MTSSVWYQLTMKIADSDETVVAYFQTEEEMYKFSRMLSLAGAEVGQITFPQEAVH